LVMMPISPLAPILSISSPNSLEGDHRAE
jgi:hypothetical protein